MPVQINEMVVRANVVENQNKQTGTTDNKGQAGGSAAIDKEEIIRECTEKVLEILKQKTER